MFFKYNKYEITEKNLYHLSMVSMLNFEIIIILLFSIMAGILLFQEQEVTTETYFWISCLIALPVIAFIVDGIYRKIKLRSRIKMLDETLDINSFASIGDKRLSENLIYKDNDWFIAVPSPEIIFINRKFVERIDFTEKGNYVEVKLHACNGKLIEYKIDDKWKYVVVQLKKWIG